MDLVIDFFRSSRDWMKAVWVLSLPLFIVSMSAIFVYYRIEMRRITEIAAKIVRR